MKLQMIAMYLGGIVFGVGLAYSGMARPEVVLSFLHLEDFGLLLVMGTALTTTLIAFQSLPRLFEHPLLSESFPKKTQPKVTHRTVTGAVIFGIGWGISGLCPATSLTALGMGNWPVLFGVLGMFLGGLIYGTIRSQQGGME